MECLGTRGNPNSREAQEGRRKGHQNHISQWRWWFERTTIYKESGRSKLTLIRHFINKLSFKGYLQSRRSLRDQTRPPKVNKIKSALIIFKHTFFCCNFKLCMLINSIHFIYNTKKQLYLTLNFNSYKITTLWMFLSFFNEIFSFLNNLTC